MQLYYGLAADAQIICLNKYEETVRKGMSDVPHAAEIKKVFPNEKVDHFISMFHHDRKQGKPLRWHSQVYFGGRYSLTYQVDIRFDHQESKFLDVVGPPIFVLEEVAGIMLKKWRWSGCRYC